jgi:hypothetical protein
MKDMRKFLILLLLILNLLLAAAPLKGSIAQTPNQQETPSQNNSYLELQGFVWHHTTLRANIITPGNASGWDPVYLNSTIRAIGQWNDALANFALNYTDFKYLSTLRIEPTVSNATLSSFDLYINWTDSSLSHYIDEIGVSIIVPYSDGTIINSSITLAMHDNHGTTINEGDAQNIAIHEIGHSLGLGHSNYTGDIMYPAYTLHSSSQKLSTLDAYGVATLFAWEKNTSAFYPVSLWLKENVVILPSNVPYEYLSVSPQNAAPQTLESNPILKQLIFAFELLVHPLILKIIILFLAFFVIIGLFIRRTNRSRSARTSFSMAL